MRPARREENGLADQINIDLTYSVCFNLANQYHVCGMYTEALNTYTLIVKNKQYAQSGRLRVNMGNIYYEQARAVRPPPRLLAAPPPAPGPLPRAFKRSPRAKPMG